MQSRDFVPRIVEEPLRIVLDSTLAFSTATSSLHRGERDDDW
jgi:hypothetical protein